MLLPDVMLAMFVFLPVDMSCCSVGGNNVGASHVGVMLVFVVLFCGSHVGVGHGSQINLGLVVLWCWTFCFMLVMSVRVFL